jgi:hypothetical protein
MKKIMILLAVACLIFVSCNNAPKATEPVGETKCEFALNLEKWATLNDEGVDQEALVAEMKIFIDECFAKCEEPKEGEEVCPIKEEWANFDNLELDGKITLIDKIFEHKKECCKHNDAAEEVTEEVAEEATE